MKFERLSQVCRSTRRYSFQLDNTVRNLSDTSWTPLRDLGNLSGTSSEPLGHLSETSRTLHQNM